MASNLCTTIRIATLAGCAVSSRLGISDPWHVCGLVAAAEGLAVMTVRIALARLWADELVTNGKVELTDAGWRELGGNAQIDRAAE